MDRPLINEVASAGGGNVGPLFSFFAFLLFFFFFFFSCFSLFFLFASRIAWDFPGRKIHSMHSRRKSRGAFDQGLLGPGPFTEPPMTKGSTRNRSRNAPGGTQASNHRLFANGLPAWSPGAADRRHSGTGLHSRDRHRPTAPLPPQAHLNLRPEGGRHRRSPAASKGGVLNLGAAAKLRDHSELAHGGPGSGVRGQLWASSGSCARDGPRRTSYACCEMMAGWPRRGATIPGGRSARPES